MMRREAGIVVIPIPSRFDVIHGIPVALGRGVPVVKVGCGFRRCELNISMGEGRQHIHHAHKNWLAVTRMIGWTGDAPIEAPGPASGVVGGVRVIYPPELRLTNFVEFLWWILLISLMRIWVGRWIQTGHRLFYRHDVERSHEWPRRRTDRPVRRTVLRRTQIL